MPLVLYAARVRGVARGLARRGVAVPERLRPLTARICAAPCVTRLARGHYVIAAALPDSTRVPVAEAVRVTGPTDIDLRYTSRQGLRTAGWVMVVGGLVTATASGLAGLGGAHNDSLGRYAFWGGMTLGLAVGSAGAFLAFQHDSVEVEAVPVESD
jgi:hypothetical protein